MGEFVKDKITGFGKDIHHPLCELLKKKAKNKKSIWCCQCEDFYNLKIYIKE